jgi:hypothetical protein
MSLLCSESTSVLDVWNLWWSGCPAEQIGSFRRLRTFDFPDRTNYNSFLKAKLVVNKLVDLIEVSKTAVVGD